jgi:hypothetical protein
MNEVSKTRFVADMAVFTIGIGLWLSHWGFLTDLAPVLWWLGNLSSMTPSERARPLRRTETLWILFILAAIVGLGFAEHYWIPDWSSALFDRIIHHPALILPLWLLGIWLSWRRWNRSRQKSGVA